MRAAAAWLFILILALLILIAGFQGSFGRMLAVLFVPGRLQISQ